MTAGRLCAAAQRVSVDSMLQSVPEWQTPASNLWPPSRTCNTWTFHFATGMCVCNCRHLSISDAVLLYLWQNIFIFQGEWCWHQVLNWMLLGHQIERAECQLLQLHHWYLCLEDCTKVYSMTSLLETRGTSLWSGDQHHKATFMCHVHTFYQVV